MFYVIDTYRRRLLLVTCDEAEIRRFVEKNGFQSQSEIVVTKQITIH